MELKCLMFRLRRARADFVIVFGPRMGCHLYMKSEIQVA